MCFHATTNLLFPQRLAQKQISHNKDIVCSVTNVAIIFNFT